MNNSTFIMKRLKKNERFISGFKILALFAMLLSNISNFYTRLSKKMYRDEICYVYIYIVKSYTDKPRIAF